MSANLDQMKLDETAEAKDRETTAGMRDRLARAYSPPNWATLFDVRNAGGFDADRAADALSIGVWPSTGHLLVGFEIKVSRADWLRELKDPWKSEAFAKFCDEWWLVVSKADIVKPGELPDGWGVMVPHGHGIKRAHQARRREKPEPLERGLLAAMFKRASTMEAKDIEAHYMRGVEQGNRQAHHDYDHQKTRVIELQDKIKIFEAASGVDLNGWHGETKIGEAVKFVLDGGIENQRREMKRIDACAAEVREAIAKLAATELLGKGASE